MCGCVGRSEDSLHAVHSSTKWVRGDGIQFVRFGSKCLLCRASEKDELVKGLAVKLNELSSIPETYTVEK